MSNTATEPTAREQADRAAAGINDTYSLAGAEMSEAQAAEAGILSLAGWDKPELLKVYGTDNLEMAEQRMRQQQAASIERRVAAERQRQADRASIIGGLAWAGPIDVNDAADLDDLSDDIKRRLPWHIRNTGPGGNGTTFIRKSWTADEALEAAKMLDWNVRKAPARWSTSRDAGRSSRTSRGKFLIVRDPVPRYAATCQCDGFHQRPGETKTKGQELCPWLVEWDLGICRSEWKAEFQNEQMVDVLATFTELGEVTLSSAIWLRGGERVGVQMRMGDTWYALGRDDPHTSFLGIHNNFSGRGASIITEALVRDGCDNTYLQSEKRARAAVAVAHKGDMGAKLATVGAVMLEAEGYRTAYQRWAEELAAIEGTLKLAAATAEAVIPDSPHAHFKRADAVGFWATDETLPDDLRRTGYGIVQSFNRLLGQEGDKRTDTSRWSASMETDGKAHLGTKKAAAVVKKLGQRRVRVNR
jgi:hypothetical protein